MSPELIPAPLGERRLETPRAPGVAGLAEIQDFLLREDAGRIALEPAVQALSSVQSTVLRSHLPGPPTGGG